ncbi:MAG TPA: Spy/CpxP family protein refolding chaperone [Terriglobales bacterium]|jgi:Spy/CpxP family protein refolding chaperone|nr:Spy/CpxP family protein refolding chaperone [Terriglobales bacterium]
MKSRYIFPLIAAGVLFVGTSAWSQSAESGTTPQGQEHHRGKRMGPPGGGFERMAERLNLTEQQKSQIKPIFDNNRKEMEALRDDTSLTQDQKRERFMQMRDQTKTQVDAILTPEQKQQMQEMQEKMRNRRRGHGGPGGPGGHGPGAPDGPPPQQ